MLTFQIPAQLEGYNTIKDGSLKIRFETGELSPQEMSDIHYAFKKVGYLAFKPDAFATHELDEIDKLKVEFNDIGKPPSQRLRAVLYRLWQQKPEGYKVSNDHYLACMEKIITYYKNKLV